MAELDKGLIQPFNALINATIYPEDDQQGTLLPYLASK